MNIELQTSELSNNESNQKICILSTKFRWFKATLTLEFLQRSHESGQPSQP